MQLPLHPIIVHFPIALTFILPFMILAFAYMIKVNKMSNQAWFIVISLQLATTITGYVALDSGETEEHQVEKVVDKKIIHAHEESAEIFVGSTVLALVLSVAAFFLRKELQFMVQLGIALVSLVSCYLAYNTGHSGGALVYEHGAASAYAQVTTSRDNEGLLPTPGMNTSESPMPVEENESLKADDNDYGNADESDESEYEESKQED